MIDLKQLVHITPFPADVKHDLLEKVDSLSEDKRYELTQLCWGAISTEHQNKLQFSFQKAMHEMATGKKTYSKEDFAKMEEVQLSELLRKLDVAENQQEIEEVRQKLKAHLTNEDTTP